MILVKTSLTWKASKNYTMLASVLCSSGMNPKVYNTSVLYRKMAVENPRACSCHIGNIWLAHRLEQGQNCSGLYLVVGKTPLSWKELLIWVSFFLSIRRIFTINPTDVAPRKSASQAVVSSVPTVLGVSLIFFN